MGNNEKVFNIKVINLKYFIIRACMNIYISIKILATGTGISFIEYNKLFIYIFINKHSNTLNIRAKLKKQSNHSLCI
jgi:hypothetical protein